LYTGLRESGLAKPPIVVIGEELVILANETVCTLEVAKLSARTEPMKKLFYALEQQVKMKPQE